MIDLELIKKYLQEGKNYSEIAKLLNITKQAVSCRCKNHNLVKIKKEKKKITSYYEKYKTRLLEKHIKTNSGCWEWTGALSTAGYGRMSYKGYADYAHRVSYEIFKGKIPKELQVCHSCDNRKCINPDHLWLGTHRENLDDMMQKRTLQT